MLLPFTSRPVSAHNGQMRPRRAADHFFIFCCNKSYQHDRTHIKTALHSGLKLSLPFYRKPGAHHRWKCHHQFIATLHRKRRYRPLHNFRSRPSHSSFLCWHHFHVLAQKYCCRLYCHADLHLHDVLRFHRQCRLICSWAYTAMYALFLCS